MFRGCEREDESPCLLGMVSVGDEKVLEKGAGVGHVTVVDVLTATGLYTQKWSRE